MDDTTLADLVAFFAADKCQKLENRYPVTIPLKTLVSVEGHRWAIEDSFETAKNEFGLDHNESRSWHGWHRHVSLVMLAFAMMAAIQHQANKPAPKKTKSGATPRHSTSSVGRSRKSAA